MKRESKESKELAFHEAGHALAAIKLDLPLTSVSIRPGKKFEGRIILSKGRRRGRRLTDLDVKHLIVDLAGPLAERILSGHEGDYTEPEIVHALDICEGRLTKESQEGGDDYLPEEVAVKRLERYMEQTERLLRKNWRNVERIAHALLERKYLTREQVLKLLKGGPIALRRTAKPPI